jgi:hypothetical protein
MRKEALMDSKLEGWGARAIWALSVYGLLLALSTLTHQPDYKTDFPAYARYVTTERFLVSHLGASIAGAGIALIGAAALLVLTYRSAPRRATWGFSLWAIAQVSVSSVFGVAAFFQPAIGWAFLNGDRDVAVAVNEDVYGTMLFVTVGVSLVLFIVGAVLLGTGANRVPGWPRWAGIAFWVGVILFAISGFTIEVLQPVAGIVVAVAGVGFALASRRELGHG